MYNFGSVITGEIQGERTISGGWEIIGNYSKLFRALMENPAGNRKLWKNYAELSHRGVFFATTASNFRGTASSYARDRPYQ